MNYDELKVGFKIRKMRELKDLTRKDVAAMLQISERSYVDIENENINITLQKLCDICRVFECDLCALLEFSGKKVFSFYVNNNGEKMQNINHQEIINEKHLLELIMKSKDEVIASKNAHIIGLEKQLTQLQKNTSG